MPRNLDTVQALYQAFGRGDLPAILALLSDQVRWEEWADNSAQRAGVPTLLAHRSPEGVTAFFRAVAELQLHEFKVLDVIGDGNQVAAEVLIDFSVPATGVRVRDEELHLWSFDADGKVVRMRHYVDTAKHLRAHGLTAA